MRNFIHRYICFCLVETSEPNFLSTPVYCIIQLMITKLKVETIYKKTHFFSFRQFYNELLLKFGWCTRPEEFFQFILQYGFKTRLIFLCKKWLNLKFCTSLLFQRRRLVKLRLIKEASFSKLWRQKMKNPKLKSYN